VIAGRYRLDELLGRGGMSEVWRAKDLELGRDVALKLLAPDADTARFDREARAVASLAHPNITQLYDYGAESGRPYMVLEYVPGGTLEDRLRGGTPLPDDTTRAVAAGIAAGLAHAHARGLVHRDLKPANVLFDAEERPKVADFGVARMASGEGTLTEAGTVLGTAAYISPEQAMGETATPASDVYSFGVILYRMLTGRLPFESDDPMELVLQHRDAAPPPIAKLRADAPAALESTATASLAKDPADRPADGEALLAELGVSPGAPTRVLPVAPAPTDVYPEPPPQRRSNRPLIIAALVLVAIGGGALAYALTSAGSSPAPVETLPPLTGPTTTGPTTSAATTTQEATTTQPTTTQPPTTSPPRTTTQAPTTTAPTTTAEATTTEPPTTTAPPTTTEPPPTTAPPATTDTTTPTSTTP
jgi:serine/threonine-protein kinase